MVSTRVKGRPARAAAVSPHPPGGLETLRRRFEAGEGVTLAEAFRAAGLTAREEYVLRERLMGRSFAAIARDGPMRRAGRPVSKQRVHQLERLGTAKLGLRSVAQAVHRDDRAERAALLAERGRRVRTRELRHESAVFGRRRVPRWQEEHERAVAAFLAAA